MRFPEIDYEGHPAYSPYRSVVSYDDSYINEAIATADLTYAEYCRKGNPSQRDAEYALSLIRGAMERILLHTRQRGISMVAQEWLQSCMRWAAADMGYEFMRQVFSKREYRSTRLSTVQMRQLTDMNSKGMYITPFPGEIYGEIRRLALFHRAELIAKAKNDPFNRSVINVPFNSAIWRAIKRGAREAGIVDVLSELKGNRMSMLGAGLEYSSPGQSWYQNIYSDVGLTGGPFQYLHFDEGYCLPKMMIYVTPVGENNGPTRAVPGSNRWDSSELRLRMYRALDRIVGDRYDTLSVQGSYRTMARTPELRRIFMDLPVAFRGSSHFGDDIMPGTALAEVLAKLECPYLSEGAQAFVFDGPHVLHRGSLVQCGERMALQVIFRNRSEASIKARMSKDTFVKEQVALGRKYLRKFVMSYL